LNTSCDQHEPYPKGLCNRCLPENVTLKRQEYRHVDYVQFTNNSQVQDFIKYWVQEKKMAEMRVAFIYGYYA
jgi:nuclear protein localization protein 4 homolog